VPGEHPWQSRPLLICALQRKLKWSVAACLPIGRLAAAVFRCVQILRESRLRSVSAKVPEFEGNSARESGVNTAKSFRGE